MTEQGLYVNGDGHVIPVFAELMVRLAIAYPTTGRLSEMTIRTYARALGDVPWPALTEAGARAIRESRFFPSVAELRGYVEASVDDAGLLAWAWLGEQAERIGAYASLSVADPCAAAALEAVFGSWPAYCATEGPALGARRAEFLAAYRQARRQPSQGSVRLLPGWCGQDETPAAQPVLADGVALGRKELES